MPDRREALPRIGGGADLHAVGVAEVVDDVDPRRRKLRIHDLAVAPLAHRADPAGRVAHAQPAIRTAGTATAAHPSRRRHGPPSRMPRPDALRRARRARPQAPSRGIRQLRQGSASRWARPERSRPCRHRRPRALTRPWARTCPASRASSGAARRRSFAAFCFDGLAPSALTRQDGRPGRGDDRAALGQIPNALALVAERHCARRPPAPAPSSRPSCMRRPTELFPGSSESSADAATGVATDQPQPSARLRTARAVLPSPIAKGYTRWQPRAIMRMQNLVGHAKGPPPEGDGPVDGSRRAAMPLRDHRWN